MKTIEWISRIQDILEELPELNVLNVGYNAVTEIASVQIENNGHIEKLGKVRDIRHYSQYTNHIEYYTYIDGVRIFCVELGDES